MLNLKNINKKKIKLIKSACLDSLVLFTIFFINIQVVEININNIIG